MAILLRLPFLSGSFWLDEAAQALESSRSWSQQLSIRQDFQPPLLHLITFGALQVSQTEWWLRTIGALLPALGTVIYTYLLGERLVKEQGRWIGLAAGILIATSSFHIFYSQELRPYSLATFWAVMSWYHLLQAPPQLRRQWLVFGIATAAGLYSMYLYPFVILSQVLYVLLAERTKLRSLFISLIGAGLAFLPWLPQFWGQLSEGQALRASLPGWEAVVSTPQLKAIPLVFGKFLFGVVDLEFSLYFVVVTALALGCLGWCSFKLLRQTTHTSRKQALFLLIALLVPVVAGWVVSFAVPVVQAKRMLVVLPFWYLTISWLILTAPRLSGWVQGCMLSLFITINITGTLAYWSNPLYQRENWREVQQTLTEQYQHSTVAIFAFNQAVAPWQWYDNGTFPVVATGSLVGVSDEELSKRLAPAFEYQYVLVFDYLRDLTDPERKIEDSLRQWGYEEAGLHVWPNIGFVRLYARPTAVLSYSNDLSRH